jgi:hypothetical protein
MFLFFRERHCPICGVKGIKNGSYYRCVNCESIFSDFGIVQGPFNEIIGIERSEIFEDN